MNIVRRIEVARFQLEGDGLLKADNLILGYEEKEELWGVIRKKANYLLKLDCEGEYEFMDLNVIVVPIRNHLSLSVNVGGE